MLGLVQMAVGSMGELAHQLGDVFTNSEFKSALNAISPPTYVTSGLAIIGLITIIVRLRGGSPDPLK